MKKLAVIFPGIGYHTDKPILFYSKKLAKQYGYEVMEVPYKDLLKNAADPEKKLESAFYTAFEQTEELLKDVSFGEYEQLLFISKSIGTVVASAYAKKWNLNVKHILYTPVEQTFLLTPNRVWYCMEQQILWQIRRWCKRSAGRENCLCIRSRMEIIRWKQEMCSGIWRFCGM